MTGSDPPGQNLHVFCARQKETQLDGERTSPLSDPLSAMICLLCRLWWGVGASRPAGDGEMWINWGDAMRLRRELDANLQVSEISLFGLVSYTSKGMLENKQGIHI